MAKFKNVSPIGALDIPALDRVVDAGEVFEATKETEAYFAAQPGNFQRITEPKRPKASKTAAPVEPVAPSGADKTNIHPSGDEKEEESR